MPHLLHIAGLLRKFFSKKVFGSPWIQLRRSMTTTPITTATTEETHIASIRFTFTLTSSRTRTNIRHHPSMCCFHCSCPSFVLLSSSRPSQFQFVPRVCLYVYLFALLSISLTIELFVSLVSLLIALSPRFPLSRVVTSLVCGCGSNFLVREFLPFPFLFTCAV
jgi:hypothetical protein